VAAANRFLLQFEETYGRRRPDFYPGAYVKVSELSCKQGSHIMATMYFLHIKMHTSISILGSAGGQE
jgi:hypothetical protein